MTREQLSIAGTEPARNKHVDEALFAMLDAQQRKRSAAADEKRWHAALQVRLTDAKILSYPYTDPDTGKRKAIAPEAKIVLKTRKAPAERKGRGRRSKRGRDEEQDADSEGKAKSEAPPPDTADPFAATRASMREGKREKDGRTLLDEAREDERAEAEAEAAKHDAEEQSGVHGSRDLETTLARFSVGDRVTWTSAANGTTKRKTGEVIAVVPAHKRPGEVSERMRVNRFASTRDHVSYGVEVDGEIYWPIVDKLKPARGGKGKRS